MVWGKKVANFDWKRGRNSAPREGQKILCNGGSHFEFGNFDKIPNVIANCTNFHYMTSPKNICNFLIFHLILI